MEINSKHFGHDIFITAAKNPEMSKKLSQSDRKTLKCYLENVHKNKSSNQNLSLKLNELYATINRQGIYTYQTKKTSIITKLFQKITFQYVKTSDLQSLAHKISPKKH